MARRLCEACLDEHPALRIWETDSLLCLDCGHAWLRAPEKAQMAAAIASGDNDVIPLLFRSFADRQWKSLKPWVRARRWLKQVMS